MASGELSPRASVASTSELSLVDPAAAGKLLSKKDKVPGTVKLKKSIAKKTKPKDGEGNELKAGGATRSPSPDSAVTNDIDTDLKSSYPSGRPLEDRPDTIQCKHCKKPMLKSVAASHTKICEQKKKERARKKKEAKEASQRAKESKPEDKDKDGDAPMEDSVTVSRDENTDGIIKSAKKSAAKETPDGGPKKSKKRKADGEGDKEPKKKKAKKDEPPKPKLPKPKGPVDVEKQCGVLLPNGGFCARSLTCKSHSMGAKRAVPGRSLPYDILLAQYQKKNQAKQQKAAISANAPLADDFETTGPIDSDEEKDAVMAAIARSRPRPLEQHIHIPTRRKYQYVRMKEMLGNALGGGSRAGGGLFGRVAADGGDTGVAGDGAAERRGSVVMGGNRAAGAGQAQRKMVGGVAGSVS